MSLEYCLCSNTSLKLVHISLYLVLMILLLGPCDLMILLLGPHFILTTSSEWPFSQWFLVALWPLSLYLPFVPFQKRAHVRGYCVYIEGVLFHFTHLIRHSTAVAAAAADYSVKVRSQMHQPWVGVGPGPRERFDPTPAQPESVISSISFFFMGCFWKAPVVICFWSVEKRIALPVCHHCSRWCALFMSPCGSATRATNFAAFDGHHDVKRDLLRLASLQLSGFFFFFFFCFC